MIIYKSQLLKYSGDFKWLISIFALHNLCEVVLFSQTHLPWGELWSIRAYYSVSLAAACYMLVFALRVSGCIDKKKAMMIFFLAPLIPIILVIFSDLIIKGNQYILGKYYADHGDYYIIFSLFVCSSLLLIPAALVAGYRNASATITQVRCIYVGLALLPISIAVIGVVIFQAFGIQANTVFLLPLTSTLFLLILYKSEDKHQLMDLRTWLPWSAENRAAKEIQIAQSDYFMEKISYQEFKQKVERVSLEKSLCKAGGSVSTAAKFMGLNRTTVYSMMNKHGISAGATQTNQT